MTGRSLLLLSLALSIAGCDPRQQANVQPNELIVARLSEPISLNPLYLQGSDRNDISRLVYSFLTTYDSRGQIVPDVASAVPSIANGGISADGTGITYHLRHDAKWQDGEPLTADDVEFTFRAITNPANSLPAQAPYEPILRVSACDRYTVCVRLKRPFAPIVAQFFGADGEPILPKHLLHRYRSLDGVPFNSAPIGSGPYRVEKWLRGDRIDFVANSSYYGGKPNLGRISIRIVPNHTTIFNQLRSGETDATYFADPSKIALYRALPNDLVVVTQDRPSFGTIVFDLTDPIVRDVAVRRAFQFALDRNEIARKATSGLYDADTGLRGLFGWAYDPNADAVAPDLQRARAILGSAGWNVGPDGIRSKSGARLHFHLVYFGQSFAADAIVPLLIAQAKAAGIEIDAKPYDVNALYAKNGPLYRHTFQLALLGLQSNLDPNPSQYLACNQRTPAGFNFASYCNASVDAAIRRALATYDRPARRREYSYVQRAVVRDVPYLFLWQSSEVDVVPRRLKGYEPNAAGGPYASVARWYLSGARQRIKCGGAGRLATTASIRRRTPSRTTRIAPIPNLRCR